jgi:hypothetical protein
MRKSQRILLPIPVALAAMLIASTAASAQPAPSDRGPPGYGWGPGMMMGPGMMGGRGMSFMCNPRSAGMAEWRINQIEASVRPTETQKAKLSDLRTASTKAAETLAAACAGDVPSKSTERMAQMEKRVEAMLLALKTVRPAFDALYESLDNDQKSRLDATGPRRWGWSGWRWRWE